LVSVPFKSPLNLWHVEPPRDFQVYFSRSTVQPQDFKPDTSLYWKSSSQHMGISENRGAQSASIYRWIFHEINRPASGGPPWLKPRKDGAQSVTTSANQEVIIDYKGQLIQLFQRLQLKSVGEKLVRTKTKDLK
jgi:hypothetical protein